MRTSLEADIMVRVADALNRGIVLEWLTVMWTAVAGAVGLAAGIISHGVSLTAFGLDSVVELICAVILIQRLKREVSHGVEGSLAFEKRASTIVGLLLLAAAAYVSIDATLHFLHHVVPAVSLVGIALTIATIPIMVPLARGKLRIARLIGSRALRADAIGNVVCWYLAAAVLASLIVESYFHIGWLDGAASLLIVGLLVFEGIEAVRGVELAP